MDLSVNYETIIDRVNFLTSRESTTTIIGIDGCGGSGKSTLSKLISEKYSEVTIVHMDDFYLPSANIIQGHPTEKPIGADYDWQRVIDQVLAPLMKRTEGLLSEIRLEQR